MKPDSGSDMRWDKEVTGDLMGGKREGENTHSKEVPYGQEYSDAAISANPLRRPRHHRVWECLRDRFRGAFRGGLGTRPA
jgi:hypothetical protein